MPGGNIDGFAGWPFNIASFCIIKSYYYYSNIISSYFFYSSNYFKTSGGIGSIPNYYFLVNYTGYGGGLAYGGVFIIIYASIYLSTNNLGISSGFIPAAYIIANASSGDVAPKAFINYTS